MPMRSQARAPIHPSSKSPSLHEASDAELIAGAVLTGRIPDHAHAHRPVREVRDLAGEVARERRVGLLGVVRHREP